MRRRLLQKNRELEDFIIRFYPAGNYTWTVPSGCREVDVFLVGAGGGCSHNSGLGVPGGGGGGYGGGAGGNASGKPTKGGDGTVLIRGRRYKS